MKSFLKRIAALILAGGLAASIATVGHAEDKTVRIGFQKYGTLILLKTQGLLEKKLQPLGYTVQWTEFPAGPQLLEGLNVGAIDFGTTGEAPPIFAQAAGAPLVYVGYEPPAPGAEAILVPKDSEAIDVAAETIDKYLTWGEPPAAVAEKIAVVKTAAAKRGRKVSFGIRLHVIVRETADAAWTAADSLIKHVDDETIAKAQAVFARMDSVGQSRMAALHGGKRDKLEVSPNLWAGVGLVRGGAGTALVGDPETVAARIEEYRLAGVDTFILSGYPHLEEAYRFAELVFPLLPLAHAPDRVALSVNTGPFGETIANEHRPAAPKAERPTRRAVG